jgi:hypothetical protein
MAAFFRGSSKFAMERIKLYTARNLQIPISIVFGYLATISSALDNEPVLAIRFKSLGKNTSARYFPL